jgi:ABC-type nickel/cobalt efflux system permease component RcnA
MGNFSVNHYSKIVLEGDRIQIRYFIDLAEIPTFQELQQANIATTAIDPNSTMVISYVTNRGTELGRGLALDVDNLPVILHLISSGVIFPPGAGGLPTMKMGFVYEAAYPATLSAVGRQHATLHYADNNYPGHTGWKEIVAQASAGSLLQSSVPQTDRSSELSNYPTDLLTSPPQVLEAALIAALPVLPSAVVEAQKMHSLQPASVATPAQNHPEELRTAVQKQPATKTTSTPLASSSAAPIAMNLQANQQKTPRSKFTELIQAEHLSAWFLFTAALIAIGLGALHALEPGHGKTIVAAYLVGSKGTARHAFLLGIIVTVAHTAGVFALGAITLYASRYIVPEQLYPWLGALSGITIAGLGAYMLMRRLTGTAVEHSHAPGSPHSHSHLPSFFHTHSHDHSHAQSHDHTHAHSDDHSLAHSHGHDHAHSHVHTHAPLAPHSRWMFWKTRNGKQTGSHPVKGHPKTAHSVSLTQLFTLGITGGIIPCPAALVVLLSACALHRIGLGLFLIVAFSIGLAAVLIGFGMLMVYARRFMTRLQLDGPLTRRWLPAASSCFITILGLALAFQALSTVHLSLHMPSQERLGPILFVTGLGLILGMRHSTDADHVVAISTIVTKQRSIRNAAFIGSVWGLGHTITIFIVGSLIILFGVEIPPRLGLSMEFSVALMLILLGVLNLTGVLQQLTRYFTPAIAAPADTQALAQQSNDKTRMEKWLDKSVGRFGLYQCLRPLVIGLVHGLAGSAAVALLVLSTIHNPIWATIYLLIFGAGTMVGMMCMTAAIAVPLTFAGDRFTKLGQYLGTASGMVSLCFGSFLVYQLGFLGGLFTSHPQWTPR